MNHKYTRIRVYIKISDDGIVEECSLVCDIKGMFK